MSIRDRIKADLHEASGTPAEPPKFLHAAMREPYRRAVKRGATVTFGKGDKKATELVVALPDEDTLQDVARVVQSYVLVKRIPGTTMLKLTVGYTGEPEQTEASDPAADSRAIRDRAYAALQNVTTPFEVTKELVYTLDKLAADAAKFKDPNAEDIKTAAKAVRAANNQLYVAAQALREV